MSDKIFSFTIPGEPKGKGRPRFLKNGRTYTPNITTGYENLVKLTFKQAYPDDMPFTKDIPLMVSIRAYFTIPKSASKKKTALMKSADIYPTKKPDTDNIAKIVLDSLNGIAYHDDSQIVGLYLVKLYDDTPRVEIEISECVKEFIRKYSSSVY